METINIKETQRKRFRELTLRRMRDFPTLYPLKNYIFSFREMKVGYLVVNGFEIFWVDEIKEIEV